jgi:asparagine synthase (glutamine-hydrolysing)
MKFDIQLLNNKGFNWINLDNIWVKGYAFNSENNYLTEVELAQSLHLVKDIVEFGQVISSLNGIFSVVIKLQNSTLLATDITRAFPLFYTKVKETYIVTDNAVLLQKNLKLQMSEKSKKEFLCTGFVTGSKTLLTGLHQVQSAEVVEINNSGVHQFEYWTYATKDLTNKDFRKLQLNLLSIYERLIKRLIKMANGKTIVIPLSGGYDSRLVLALLVKYGYKKVHCFTYGVSTSFEISIAERVTKRLGINLTTINYSNTFIDEHFNKSEIFDYIRYGSNFVSLSHVQDFLAVKYLNLNNLIPEDAIFVPGHSGDIFAGTHLSVLINGLSKPELVKQEITKKHFTLNEGCKGDINYYNESYLPFSSMEAWSWKERQAKFIVNSLRIYEYFNYQFALPLWDSELASFFKKIPLKLKNRNKYQDYKIENNLYDSVTFQIFREFDIAFEKIEENQIFRKILNRLIGIFSNKKDLINNFDYFLAKLSKENLHKQGSKGTNSELVNIYIEILKR